MKFKKLFLAVLIFALFGFTANAYGEHGFSECVEASGADKLSEYLNEETAEYMKKLGCDELEFEKIMDISPLNVFKLIGELIRNGFSAPLKGMLKAAGTVLLISVVSSFFPNDEKSRAVLNLVCGSFVVVTVMTDATAAVNSAAGAIKSCAAFEKALIPVLAAILTVSGNPLSAASVQGSAFAAAQIIENLAESFILPLAGISTALNIVGAMLTGIRVSAIGEIIRKVLITVFSASAGIFSGMLSLKAVLSSGADSLAVKGIKMASSTFVPIVGGALGDIYISFASSVSLLKTTVGIYAVIALFAIAIPVVINLAMWALSMRIASAVSDLLGCGQCSEILKSIGFLFSCVNTILILCVSVFIVTAGITVLIKNGG
jgi:stage III sporulation protein AE